MSAQAIYSYETDRTSPSADVLAKIARALNVPEAFFLMPPRGRDQGTIFYRSLISATKGARNRAEWRTSWLRDITNYLAEFVALPPSNLPHFNLPDDPLLLSDDEIEEAATETRRHWKLGEGPIADVVLLLENQGMIVARDRLGAEALDSVSEFVPGDDRPYIIIGTDKGTPARWRFDAAHELAHVILHRHVSTEYLSRAGMHGLVESQAHRFASAFLLPLPSFGEDLIAANLDSFRALKPKWKISIGMMIKRARDAGFISETSEKSLWVSYTRRRWRKIEPWDDAMDAEEPRLLRRSFEVLLDSGTQTAADVAGRLALPTFDIESLAGLPSGYLSGYARVALLPEMDLAPDIRDSRVDLPRAPVIPIRAKRKEN